MVIFCSSFNTCNKYLQGAEWRNPVKTLNISIVPGQGLLQDYHPMNDLFQHWDILYSAGSFLRKQVRITNEVKVIFISIVLFIAPGWICKQSEVSTAASKDWIIELTK